MARRRICSTGEEQKVDPAEEVKQCVVDFNQCDKELRIAFVGYIGDGKSSTQNSVAAYTCNPPRVKQVAKAFSGGEVIRYFTEHALEVWDPASGKNAKSNIIMVDTAGKICKDLRLQYEQLEHSHRQEELTAAMILENMIVPLQQAGTTALVVVVSAQQVWKEAKLHMSTFQLLKGGPLQIPEESFIHPNLQMLKRIITAGGARCMRPICIVTHADVADSAVRRDMRKLPASSTIRRITAYVASQLGLNPNLVHTMVNLRNEFDPASNMELGRVALNTFRHVLQAAEDGHNELTDNPSHPPPSAPDAGHIKATGNSELNMLRFVAQANGLPSAV